MSLTVNGQRVLLPEPPTLEALLQTFSPQRPFAIAHNGEFVPHVNFQDCKLSDGDSIEIVHPSAGG